MKKEIMEFKIGRNYWKELTHWKVAKCQLHLVLKVFVKVEGISLMVRISIQYLWSLLKPPMKH